MKIAAIILAVVLFLGGAPAYFLYFSTEAKRERATVAALQTFSEAVMSQDRSKVSAALQTLLTNDTKINLSVQLLSITQQTPPMVQDFNKEQFIGFLDNVLFTLSDYHYEVKLDEFLLAEDGKTAAVKFSSKQWADGNNHYGVTSVAMRFSGSASCEGQARFERNQAQLAQAACKVEYRAVPKPGEYNKVKEQLKDQLLPQP